MSESPRKQARCGAVSCDGLASISNNYLAAVTSVMDEFEMTSFNWWWKCGGFLGKGAPSAKHYCRSSAVVHSETKTMTWMCGSAASVLPNCERFYRIGASEYRFSRLGWPCMSRPVRLFAPVYHKTATGSSPSAEKEHSGIRSNDYMALDTSMCAPVN